MTRCGGMQATDDRKWGRYGHVVEVHARWSSLPATERRRVEDGLAPARRPRRLLEPTDPDDAGAPAGLDVGALVAAGVDGVADGRALDSGRRLRRPAGGHRRPRSASGPPLDAGQEKEEGSSGRRWR